MLETALLITKTSRPIYRYLCMHVNGVHAYEEMKSHHGQLLQDHFFEFKRAGSRIHSVGELNYRTRAHGYRCFPKKQRNRRRTHNM